MQAYVGAQALRAFELASQVPTEGQEGCVATIPGLKVRARPLPPASTARRMLARVMRLLLRPCAVNGILLAWGPALYLRGPARLWLSGSCALNACSVVPMHARCVCCLLPLLPAACCVQRTSSGEFITSECQEAGILPGFPCGAAFPSSPYLVQHGVPYFLVVAPLDPALQQVPADECTPDSGPQLP